MLLAPLCLLFLFHCINSHIFVIKTIFHSRIKHFIVKFLKTSYKKSYWQTYGIFLDPFKLFHCPLFHLQSISGGMKTSSIKSSFLLGSPLAQLVNCHELPSDQVQDPLLRWPPVQTCVSVRVTRKSLVTLLGTDARVEVGFGTTDWQDLRASDQDKTQEKYL